MTAPADHAAAWAQLYTWLGYHKGAAVSADSVRSKMRALASTIPAGPPRPASAPRLFDQDQVTRRYP